MIKDVKSYEVFPIQRRKGMIKSVKQEWLKRYEQDCVYIYLWRNMKWLLLRMLLIFFNVFKIVMCKWKMKHVFLD